MSTCLKDDTFFTEHSLIHGIKITFTVTTGVNGVFSTVFQL